MISEYAFEDAGALMKSAYEAAKATVRLKHRAKAKGIPIIYVNDNFGKWRSDFKELVRTCLAERCPGREVVELLRPDNDDYFVLKPKHSGFFKTPLSLLLTDLKIHTLILTGTASNICVWFTASDAYMRGFRLIVPDDCLACANPHDHAVALEQMRRVLKAEVRPSSELL